MFRFLMLCVLMLATAPVWPLPEVAGVPGWAVGSFIVIVILAVWCWISFGPSAVVEDDAL